MEGGIGGAAGAGVGNIVGGLDSAIIGGAPGRGVGVVVNADEKNVSQQLTQRRILWK